MAKPKIACIIGTRPDTIKTAPVALELREHADKVDTLLVATGQHRDMLDQSLEVFGLKCDYDLKIMDHGQTLGQITTRSLEGLDKYLRKEKPDFVMAQGDTTTTFVASLASYYNQIPFGHIEAGLRTETVRQPFPEEFNRRAASMIAEQHYAPTLWAANNLYQERIPNSSVHITGNTGIDAVKMIADRKEQSWFTDTDKKIFLLTTHRRENWGEPQKRIALAMNRLLDECPDSLLVIACHPNPQVKAVLSEQLGHHPRVHIIDPPSYSDFVKLMQRSYMVFTDSGGIQEEAPIFGKPVLVLRDCTERPEGIQSGSAVLVGTNEDAIFEEAITLYNDPRAYKMMSKATSPYGDGHAARRIRSLVLGYLEIESHKEIMWISSKQSS